MDFLEIVQQIKKVFANALEWCLATADFDNEKLVRFWRRASQDEIVRAPKNSAKGAVSLIRWLGFGSPYSGCKFSNLSIQPFRHSFWSLTIPQLTEPSRGEVLYQIKSFSIKQRRSVLFQIIIKNLNDNVLIICVRVYLLFWIKGWWIST